MKSTGYEPACDLGTVFGVRMSCTNVFTSSYSHILSHWQIVPSGHALDLSLAEAGFLLYTAYFLYPILTFIPGRKMLLMAAATAGTLFSCYLLYVLKFILGDFCIVCTSFHVVNFIMVYLSWKEFNPSSSSSEKKTL